jgi:hypothetical protein
MKIFFGVAMMGLIAAVSTPTVAQTTTVRPAYGCYKVLATELSIRATALKSGAVVAGASKNEILSKRRRFCNVGGAWCPVTTKDGIQGYAEKALIAVAPCPPSLSRKVN